MSYKQQINIPGVITVGIVSVLLLIVLVLGTQAWFQAAEQDESETKLVGEQKSQLLQARDEQQRSTTQESWTDSHKVAATMPVEWAMDYLAAHDGKLPSTQP